MDGLTTYQLADQQYSTFRGYEGDDGRMTVTLPFEVNDGMVIISKSDYEKCNEKGLITHIPANQRMKDCKQKFVLNVKHYPGHPETGTDVTNGICPHCFSFIHLEENVKNCSYCGGPIKWFVWD